MMNFNKVQKGISPVFVEYAFYFVKATPYIITTISFLTPPQITTYFEFDGHLMLL